MGATGQPYSDAALSAARATFTRPRSATPGERHMVLSLDAAHDREALGLDASVHAASYRREVIEELAAQLESRGWHLGAQAVRELGGDHGEGIAGPRPETATGGPVPSLNAACLAEIKRLQHFIDEAFAHVIGRDCAAARIALTNARWGAPLPTEGTTDG